MTTYEGYEAPELIVTSVWKNFRNENTRVLYVGDENFLKRSSADQNSVSISANQGLMAMVNNWYGQHQQPLIAEVMDAGLRMVPDVVVFSYEDVFLSGHENESLELILSCLTRALYTGHSVGLIYRKESSLDAPAVVAEAFPEFVVLTDD